MIAVGHEDTPAGRRCQMSDVGRKPSSRWLCALGTKPTAISSADRARNRSKSLPSLQPHVIAAARHDELGHFVSDA